MTDHTPDEDELVFTRVLDAPRDLVFLCMIDPGHLTHFWGPAGVSTPLDKITVDARPGGVFESVMVNDADGSEYRLRVIYDEVAEPERLAWTDPDSGMRTTSTFTDLGGGRTEVRIHQTRVPAPFLTPEARAGFATSLDRFAAYAAALSGHEGGTA